MTTKRDFLIDIFDLETGPKPSYRRIEISEKRFHLVGSLYVWDHSLTDPAPCRGISIDVSGGRREDLFFCNRIEATPTVTVRERDRMLPDGTPWHDIHTHGYRKQPMFASMTDAMRSALRDAGQAAFCAVSDELWAEARERHLRDAIACAESDIVKAQNDLAAKRAHLAELLGNVSEPDRLPQNILDALATREGAIERIESAIANHHTLRGLAHKATWQLDHIAISTGGLYYGIEFDGHIHT